MNSEISEVWTGNVRLSEENDTFHTPSLPSPPDGTSVFTSAEEMSEEKADIPNELLGKTTEKLANGDKLR